MTVDVCDIYIFSHIISNDCTWVCKSTHPAGSCVPIIPWPQSSVLKWFQWSRNLLTRSCWYWSDSCGHAISWPQPSVPKWFLWSHNLHISMGQTQPLSTIPGVTQPLLLLRNWPMQPFEKRKKNQSAFSENHHKTISFIFYKVWCDSRCLWYYIHILPQLIDDCTQVPNLGLCTWVWISSLLSSMIWTWFECWYIISFFIVFSIIFWLMFWVYL